MKRPSFFHILLSMVLNHPHTSVLAPTTHPSVQPQFPPPNDSDAWITHWKEQGHPWRMEPEIDTHRQKELDARRAIVPDIEKGIYPFREMKLSRADIEWLLATHENGRGPVDWIDSHRRERRGLDLRGADLRQVNLQSLPLTRLYTSLHHKHFWRVSWPFTGAYFMNYSILENRRYG